MSLAAWRSPSRSDGNVAGEENAGKSAMSSPQAPPALRAINKSLTILMMAEHANFTSRPAFSPRRWAW